ncbi:54S ribosomal protein L33, mitochondrial, partial [Tolypocladium paradoxum]
ARCDAGVGHVPPRAAQRKAWRAAIYGTTSSLATSDERHPAGKETSTTANAALIKNHHHGHRRAPPAPELADERRRANRPARAIQKRERGHGRHREQSIAAMSFFRITLHRSAIGLPERTRGVLAALGLRRRMQTVFHPVEPQFAGMILKVKELVRVREVDAPLSRAQVKAARTPDSGFYVERAVPRM